MPTETPCDNAELLAAIATHAQDAESPQQTVARVNEDLDTFTAALAGVEEERKILGDYCRSLEDARSAQARDNAAQAPRALAEGASQPPGPPPTPHPPVFASSSHPSSLTFTRVPKGSSSAG